MRVGGTDVDETGLSVGGATGDADGIVELALGAPFVLPTPGYLFASQPGGSDGGGVEAEGGEAPHPRS